MIETNERGDQMIADLLESLDVVEWSEWEERFIRGLRGTKRTGPKSYAELSVKQCASITQLHAKLLKGN